jgi:hypothetical protein
MYRIAWKSKATGYIGHGEFCFNTENEARDTINTCISAESKRTLEHWVEAEVGQTMAEKAAEEDNCK